MRFFRALAGDASRAYVITTFMTQQPTVPTSLRFLLSAACIVIVIAGLRSASTILVPFALALFVAVVSLPLLQFARSKGTPAPLAILLVVLIDAAALFILGWLVAQVSVEVRSEWPNYVTRIQDLEQNALLWFEARNIEVEEVRSVWFPGGSDTGAAVVGIATFLLRGATDVLTTAFLVLLFFIFLLAEAPSFSRKIRRIGGRQSHEFSRSAKIVKEIQHYLAIKTLISAITGVTIGVATWALGLDFALLWGLLAFLLNFIPNVGSIIASIPAIGIALLQNEPATAILVAAVYVGVNASLGNFLEPMLVGRQLGISTLVIVLSLVFWGWVWGPIGMFLAVPLTMALKIGLEYSEDFRWVAMLMASERKVPPEALNRVRPVPPQTEPNPEKSAVG
jgi:AI-2 transport protein TqsA